MAGQTVGAQTGAKPVTLGGVKQEEISQDRPTEIPDKSLQEQSNKKQSAQKVILQPDDEGAAVENVQRWLEQLSFLDMGVSMDKQGNKQYGFYGGATRAAVMLYQFNYGFEMTGELDSIQYLDIYSRYSHESEDVQENRGVLAYGNMVGTVSRLDKEKGYQYKAYPMYQHLRKNRPSLPSSMQEAGIRVVYKAGLYYMDYTEPLLRMLGKNIRQAKQARKSTGNPGLLEGKEESLRITEDLAWFYFKVEPGADWDIKVEKNWKAQFPGQTEGVKFFHHAYPFIFLGNVVTAEDMGNILFGATGAAMGFEQEFLKWAGATPNIKADGMNLFRSYFGDNERDLEKVEYGVRLYNAFQEDGSASPTYIWERIFSNAEYKELQSQKIELEEQIMVVDKRLNQRGWNVLTFWDWSEVDDWEQAQLAGQDARGKESAEKQARDEAAAEAKKKANPKGDTAKPLFTYEPLENKNRARNDNEVKAFVGTIIGEIGDGASSQYKKGEELTTAKAVAFVIMNCLQYQDLGYQQYNTVETVVHRYFGGYKGNGMASFTAYLEDDYKKLARLQRTSEEYVKARVMPLYEAIMKAVLPILDGIDNADFTNGARHIFSPEKRRRDGSHIPEWVFPGNEVIVDSLDGYDLKIYLE